MNAKDLIIYGSAIFLTVYGLRSIWAGIKHEKKFFWITTRKLSTSNLIQKNNPELINIVAGILSTTSGLLIFFFY